MIERAELARHVLAAAIDLMKQHGAVIVDPADIATAGETDDSEFDVLLFLARHPGQVFSRNQLMDVAYQDDIYVDDRTIDSHIKRMRKKFRDVDPEFDAIETLYGVGYRYRES